MKLFGNNVKTRNVTEIKTDDVTIYSASEMSDVSNVFFHSDLTSS